MGTIFVDQARQGMRLTMPVTTVQGQLLLDEGVVLSGKHLRILKSWGVLSIEIEESEETKTDIASEPALLMERERIGRVFSDVLDDPLMREIYEVVLRHREKHFESRSLAR